MVQWRERHLLPMWPRLYSCLWIEFDVALALLRGFFSGFSGLPPSAETNISKFLQICKKKKIKCVKCDSNSKIIVDPYKNQLRLTWLPLSLNIVIYLFLFLNPKRSFAFSLEQLSLSGGALLYSRPLQEVSRDPQARSFFQCTSRDIFCVATSLSVADGG